MTDLKVTIGIDAKTIAQLQEKNYNLFAFRAVETSGSGAPVVWFSTDGYGETTIVKWKESYQAFASNSEIKAGAQITAGCQRPIELGQMMNVDLPIQCHNPVDGTKGVITIYNTNGKAEIPSVGINEEDPEGNSSPLCAFSLFGLNDIMIVPIQKVFLMFASKKIVTSTVIALSSGPGILIDLTQNQECKVNYLANGGWDWDHDKVIAKEIPANSELAPHLINTTERLKMAANKKH